MIWNFIFILLHKTYFNIQKTDTLKGNSSSHYLSSKLRRDNLCNIYFTYFKTFLKHKCIFWKLIFSFDVESLFVFHHLAASLLPFTEPERMWHWEYLQWRFIPQCIIYGQAINRFLFFCIYFADVLHYMYWYFTYINTFV